METEYFKLSTRAVCLLDQLADELGIESVDGMSPGRRLFYSINLYQND